MTDLNKKRWGRHFTDEEIAFARDNGRLLTMEIETSHICNLRCIYCYNGSGRKLRNELSLGEILDAIRQGIDLGVRRVILIGGGEPLMYPHVDEIMAFLHAQGVAIDLFTNGTLITPDLAKQFYDLGVEPVVKCNSLNPQTQDFLVAQRGAYENIHRGLDCLREAGYPDEDHDLGIETIICSYNYRELPAMWRWAREQGMIPYFEMITFQGNAKNR
ncbi:radical SAM protein, partial [bacterium]|nr:radical SAM protein [bacterium]